MAHGRCRRCSVEIPDRGDDVLMLGNGVTGCAGMIEEAEQVHVGMQARQGLLHQ